MTKFEKSGVRCPGGITHIAHTFDKFPCTSDTLGVCLGVGLGGNAFPAAAGQGRDSVVDLVEMLAYEPSEP